MSQAESAVTSIQSTPLGAKVPDFLLYEYWQLRTEIRERLASIRTILLGSFAGVTAVLTFVGSILSRLEAIDKAPVQVQVLSLGLLVPFLILVPTLSFIICEELSIAVLARYIRTHIELAFYEEVERHPPGFWVRRPFGWETYLFDIRDRKIRERAAAKLKRSGKSMTEQEAMKGLYATGADGAVNTEKLVEPKPDEPGLINPRSRLWRNRLPSDIAWRKDRVSARGVLGSFALTTVLCLALSGISAAYAVRMPEFGKQRLDWPWLAGFLTLFIFAGVRMALLMGEYTKYVTPRSFVDVEQQTADASGRYRANARV